MEVPGTEYRPDRPVIREIVLAPDGADRSDIVFYGLGEDEYCEVRCQGSEGEIEFIIEAAGPDRFALCTSDGTDCGRLGAGERTVMFRTDMSAPLCLIENSDGDLRIADCGTGGRARVRFPYETAHRIEHAGIIRRPEEREQQTALVHVLYEHRECDLDGYSDREFAVHTYRERILDAVLKDGTVTAARLFDRFEVEEGKILMMTPEGRRNAFEEAFRTIKTTCEELVASDSSL